MNSVPLFLLAAGERYWFHLRNPLQNVTFQAMWQNSVLFLGLALLAALGVWVVIRLVRWRRNRLNTPWGLFGELCVAHGLSYRERHLLKILAIQHGLSQPATLFVDPRLWEGHGGKELFPHVDELRRLRERVFARAAKTVGLN
jgi:hypothetical protein